MPQGQRRIARRALRPADAARPRGLEFSAIIDFNERPGLEAFATIWPCGIGRSWRKTNRVWTTEIRALSRTGRKLETLLSFSRYRTRIGTLSTRRPAHSARVTTSTSML